MLDNILIQLREWFRFGLVGILATLTYLAVSIAAISLDVLVYLANLVGYLASVAISYFGHSRFTFRSEQPHRIQGPKFVLLSLTTFGLTNLIIYFVVDFLDRDPLLGSLAVAVSIPMITWALARFWVFRKAASHVSTKAE